MNEVIKLDIPQGYEFCGIESDYRKILIRKKQIEYPKTLKACSSIINEQAACGICGHKGMLLYALQCILICRDAYWKIAGEAMGLGKPWEPDWTNAGESKYCIVNKGGTIDKWIQKTMYKTLAFPTEEMRDAFFENFKDLIEQCKTFFLI